jgi:hypothetical protein
MMVSLLTGPRFWPDYYSLVAGCERNRKSEARAGQTENGTLTLPAEKGPLLGGHFSGPAHPRSVGHLGGKPSHERTGRINSRPTLRRALLIRPAKNPTKLFLFPFYIKTKLF